MCSPMPEPICLVENVNGSLCVNEKAIESLSRNNQPVVVVSVVGLYRTGKSYLMNRLAGKQKGFSLGSTIESKTKGIWMWCVPHPYNPNEILVLLDTEGLGDIDKGDSKNDAWIFCLAVLLSSTLVYNSRGTIDNTAVENLHYVTELAKQIKIKSPAANANKAEEDEEGGEESQFVQFFPNFIWAVRDFSLQLVIEERGQVTEDDYLDFALQLKKGLKHNQYNLPRECIRHYFPSRKCFVFPMPASQDTIVQLENLDESDLFPKFLDVSQRFCNYVFSASKIKTLKGGYQVTGRMFGHLVKTYVETISSGNVPCLENAVVTVVKIENEEAVQKGLKLYKSEMEKVKSLFPVISAEVFAEHQKASNTATTVFMKHAFKDEEQLYFRKLTGKIDTHYAELITQNLQASVKNCQQILADLYAEINKRVQEGYYTKSGGYKLYCTDKYNVITQYHNQPNKGIQAEEVLKMFLSGKSTEENLILQTDKQLSAVDKKIQDETDQADLLRQKSKSDEQRKQEIELLMQEKDNYQQRIQQLEKKFEDEKFLQQLELERTLERKLHEQKQLMEKAFNEKSSEMEQEIDQLKRKKERKKLFYFF